MITIKYISAEGNNEIKLIIIIIIIIMQHLMCHVSAIRMMNCRHKLA